MLCPYLDYHVRARARADSRELVRREDSFPFLEILAYLGLLQLAPLIRTSISDKVIEGRTHHQPMSATASSGNRVSFSLKIFELVLLVISKKDFAGGRSFKFVTLAGLKSVAKNLTK